MKLSELIAAVGDEHIKFQKLESDMMSARVKKNCGVIEFATDKSKAQQWMDAVLSGGHYASDYVGIVVWIPRERMPKP